ncbi:hypothetical protein [Halorussus salinus]|uniref:hypothetical protein n=1 Tax=Halorussus salinus TaxID=1364935 RepID=UPI001092F794|nr:hypothetical protein [Halorussus salinus]
MTNHDYSTPSRGSSNWHEPMNRNFERLDTDVEIRDEEANRDQYQPKEGAKFLATDTGVRYLADGSNWHRLQYPTSESRSPESADSAGDAGNFGGTRPAVNTEKTYVKVAADGSGDYESIQTAIDEEFPWLIQRPVQIDIRPGTYDEHVLLPPYLANWAEQSDRDERVPVTLKGTRDDPESVTVRSLMATGGVGATQAIGITFDGACKWDNEACAVASYNTYRLALYDCKIDAPGNAMVAYDGHLKVGRTEVNARGEAGGDNGNTGWGAKVKNMGRYWATADGTTGSVSGPAYNIDSGIIAFNHAGRGHFDGDPLVSNTGGGFAIDEGTKKIHGLNGFA